jgi:hypothetical protein
MDQAIRGAGNLHCPKCDSTMSLAGVVRRPSGLDVSIFDCSKCDHAHIVTSALESQRDTRSLNDMAVDALEEARRMSPGVQRSEALKKRGFSVELQTIVVQSRCGAVSGSDDLLKPQRSMFDAVSPSNGTTDHPGN